MSVPTARASITFRNDDGSAPLDSIWDLFSGTSIVRGETSPAGTFRVYNNYVASGSVAEADNFKLLISVEKEFRQTIINKRSAYTDFTYEIVTGGYIEVRCTVASETGLAPPTGNTFTEFTNYFSGSGFDKIVASGSWNFNEYQIRFNIPDSDVLATSGSANPVVYASWVNQSGTLT